MDINKFKGHRGSAFHGICIATGGAETAMASERNKFEFATVGAAIHGAAKGRIAAVDHFINIFNDGIPGMQSINHPFKMVCKNAL